MSTCRNILHWKKNLDFPKDSNVSDFAKDLIRRLITDSKNRLNFSQIRQHPFFKGVNWETIRSSEAAIVPKVTSDTDTQNFDKWEEQGDAPQAVGNDENGKFIGYTFKREEERENMGKDFFSNPNEN